MGKPVEETCGSCGHKADTAEMDSNSDVITKYFQKPLMGYLQHYGGRVCTRCYDVVMKVEVWGRMSARQRKEMLQYGVQGSGAIQGTYYDDNAIVLVLNYEDLLRLVDAMGTQDNFMGVALQQVAEQRRVGRIHAGRND